MSEELDIKVRDLISKMKSAGSEENRLGMARFGINTDNAFGVPMTPLRLMARRHRRDHLLAIALWRTGWHEARILAALVDDPSKVTPGQMDQWAADFSSWDVCDQACMKLFAATPYVAEKAEQWAADEREFVRRAAFAMIAGYAVRAKKAPDKEFYPFLDLIQSCSGDGRNFVKKAVNWALRQIGKRSPVLHPKALAVATKLAGSQDRVARWIGRDAVRELTDPKQLARLQLS